jgi:glycosyltransferase involved in cell wall biosynthesis
MLTIFPNYAFIKKDNQIWAESSQFLVNQNLLDAGVGLRFASVIETSDENGSLSVLDCENLVIEELSQHKASANYVMRFLFYINVFFNVLKVLRKSDFNYIYCPGHVGLIACLMSIVLNKPYAIYLRGEWKDSTPYIFHSALKLILQRAKFVVCTGVNMVKTIEKLNTNVESVVPMSPMLSLKGPKAFKIDRNPMAVRILFVGQLIKSKGIFELLEAFRKLCSLTPKEISLIIVGKGQEELALRALIESYGLGGIIKIDSIVSNYDGLADVYRNSDIFCLPSYSEGFPRVLYEAMLFSLPIVTTNVGQIPDLIENGINGVLIEPRSVEPIVSSILMLLEDSQKRSQLGLEGRKTLDPLLLSWSGKTHGQQILDLACRVGYIDNCRR